MSKLLRLPALLLLAVLALAFDATAAAAQKALVYCPTDEIETCGTVVAALGSTGAYPEGVDKAYDGSNGTVDLRTADLFAYTLFVVPSLSDDEEGTPLALLRDPAVAARLKLALLGRRAFYSGTPDLGATNRLAKNALIVNLARWAGANFDAVRGPGLVVLQDNSDVETSRYDWVRGLTGLTVTADAALKTYASVRTMTATGMTIMSSGGTQLAYDNMASFGFYFPNGAPGLSLDAVGQTGTSVGGQIVLVTAEGANTGGATVTTEKDDYAPGETVTMTGAGFGAGESVTITLHEDPLVHQDRTFTATANAQGGFVFTGFAPEPHDVGVRFILTAKGQTSGRQAQTTFTDGNIANNLAVNPSSVSVTAGGSATYTVTVNFGGNATACTANLSIAGLPAGASGTFAPSSVTGAVNDTKTSTLTVTTTSATPTGPANFTVTAARGSAGCDGSDRTATGTLVVGAAAVTSTNVQSVTASSSTYGGTTNLSATVTPAGVAGSVAFYVNGSTTAVAGATYNATTGLATVTNYTHGLNANATPYAVKAVFTPSASGFTGNEATNTSALLVSPRAITVTADAKTKVYGTAADPALTYQITTGALVGSDAFTGALTRVAGENVATSPYAIQQGTLALSTNYTLTYVGANLTITPRAITVTPTAGQSKVYGEADPALTYTPSEALLPGNAFTGALSRAAGESVAGGPYAITLGTLAAGTNYAVSLAATPVTFAITARPVTVKATSITREYGAATPAFAIELVTGSTLGNGDALAALGTPVFAPAGTTVTGSPHPIDVSGLANTNYNISYATNGARGTLTVTPRVITVTAVAKSKTYGEADPELTYTASEALLAGNSFTGALARAAGESVAGSPYAITQGTLSAGPNYQISYVSANLTVTPRSVTITPTAGQSKIYGEADPTLAYTPSEALLAGNSFSGALGRAAGESVAGSPYAITLGTLSAGANYALTLAATPVTFAITPKPITVTPNAGQTKIYGAADPAFTYTVSPALKPGDSFTGALTRAAGENVGTYAIASGTLSAGTNYAMTFAATPVTFEITPRAITVTADAKSKVYGTAADPALTYQITSGSLVGSDAFTGNLTRAAGETVAGSPYAITQGTLALSNNYTLTYVGANLTITPRPVTVTPNAGQSKVYGEADPALTYTPSEALLPGNAFTGALARASGETVAGGPYAITLGTLAAGANYAVSLAATSVTFAITPRPVVVKATDLTRTYGESTPAFAIALAAGSTLGNGDALAALGTPTFTPAGNTVAGSPHAIDVSGLANTNYNISYATNGARGTLTVTPRAITVTADAKSKVYGTADPALTYQITSGNLVGSDAFAGSLTRASGESVVVGGYAIQQGTLALSTNYALTYVGANLTITPRPITVTPTAGQTKIYGAADPTLAYTASEDLLSGNSFSGALSRVAGETVAGGPYAITLGTLAAGANYTVSLAAAPVTFAITPRPVTVKATSITRVYGASTPAFAIELVTGSTLGNGDVLAALGTPVFAPAGNTVAGSPHAIDVSGLANTNYAISYATNGGRGTLTVTPRAITVTADAKSKVYGAPDPALTYQITSGSLVGSDALTGNLTRAAGENVVAGGYAIQQGTLALSTNYALTYVGAQLMISPKEITITPTAGLSKVYGTPDPTFTYTSSEALLAGNSFTGALSRVAGENVATSPYAITMGTLTAGTNYSLSLPATPVTFAITPAPASVTLGNLVQPANNIQGPTATTTPASQLANVVFTYTVGGVQTTTRPTAVGVYPVTATINNTNYTAAPDNGYFVIYDPNGGFVTGGGWITSPAGACRLTEACAGVSGKANFGFVSKYQNGARTPTGNTEFQFQAGNLNFKSTVYEWLTVSGARAQYKGDGTINGTTGYKFILTAIDGGLPGGNGEDRFRIKIIRVSDGVIVYDNMMGGDLTLEGDVNATLTGNGTLLGGGSISIKK